ncbi:MAG: IS3 family transposase [Gammaproteobacteria bacterium]
MSPATGRRYPLSWVCAIYRISRSSLYARSRGAARVEPPGKRGPKTAWSDDEVVAAILEVLEASPFLSEGHRKVTARLRQQRGIRVGKNRVLRLMRRENLLAPVRRGRPHGDRTHSGTILATRPNELWGTDATRFYTRR